MLIGWSSGEKSSDTKQKYEHQDPDKEVNTITITWWPTIYPLYEQLPHWYNTNLSLLEDDHPWHNQSYVEWLSQLLLIFYQARLHWSVVGESHLAKLNACNVITSLGFELQKEIITLVGALTCHQTCHPVACLPEGYFLTFLVVSCCASRFNVPETTYLCLTKNLQKER